MIHVEFEYTDRSVGYRKRLTQELELTNKAIAQAQEFFFDLGACDLPDNHVNVLLYAIHSLVDVCHVSKIKEIEPVFGSWDYDYSDCNCGCQDPAKYWQ